MLVKKIQKKLKSNQGTSIFFGLLLFLVASILSAVMLSASVTAVTSSLELLVAIPMEIPLFFSQERNSFTPGFKGTS